MTGPAIGIIGAGPAGIMAALEAARRGARVLLYDKNHQVGRKLLATGAGRCNLSNLNASATRYVCAASSFMETALALHGPQQTLAILAEHGILTYATADGWCYPLSESASNVVDLLEAALRLAGVQLCLQTEVRDLQPQDQAMLLISGGPGEETLVDRVIVATGGMAFPSLGSTGEFFQVLSRLGHSIAPIRPALAPLTANMKRLRGLRGVRMDARLQLFGDGELLGETLGNVLFTAHGLSGPAAMDLAYLVSGHAEKTLVLAVDLVPYHEDALRALVARMRHRPIAFVTVLGGVLPAKVAPTIMELAGLPQEALLSDLTNEQVARVLGLLGHLSIRVTGTGSLRVAQLSTGGVPVNEVDPSTMASRIVPNLYLAGEVLDVVGPCGGYNLQFAFTSGYLAGAGTASA